MKSGYTDITIVLDRSGSMASVASDTVGGFNQFVADQKKAPGECKLTLVQFDNEYEVPYSGLAIQDVPDLNFTPRGSTALLDAIGRAINELGQRLSGMDENQRPESVLFVIMTDGEENSSREFTQEKIKRMTEHQQEVYKWTFVYIGANQDSFSNSSAMGITAANTMNYAANPVGTAAVFDSLSANTKQYRATAGAAPMISEADRKKQKAAGAR